MNQHQIEFKVFTIFLLVKTQIEVVSWKLSVYLLAAEKWLLQAWLSDAHEPW